MECKIRYNNYDICKFRHKRREVVKDRFTKLSFDMVFNIEAMITLLYMEFPKDFKYDGESHDFWEIVYIDKGEMICRSDNTCFLLKSGEMTFHKPNEFHKLAGNNVVKSNAIIITFDCKSEAMKNFEGKIFRLDAKEKGLLSQLFEEGLSCYQPENNQNPLLQNMITLKDAPLGASQSVKNLLEVFLVRMARRNDPLYQPERTSYTIDGVDIPQSVKEMVDLLNNRVYGRLTIADIASHLGRSESMVKQLFTRYFKEGIIHYYNSLKIAEAKKLIREGKYTFSEISDMLCFESPQYFSKSFKKGTGRTPSEYRLSIVN